MFYMYVFIISRYAYIHIIYPYRLILEKTDLSKLIIFENLFKRIK